MSPARSRPGAPRSIYLGDTIVEEIRATRLPFDPRHFEFWFTYKSGRNAALNVAADEIKSRTGALTAADIEHLHEAHLSPWRMAGNADSVSAHMSRKLRDLAENLEGAIDMARMQGEALSSDAAALSATTALTLNDVLGVIGRLTQSSRESQAHLALLEARMDVVSREIGALKQQLSAVRTDCTSDPTTALPNRATFDAMLAKALAEASETRQPMSVMLCDLDYFATFNENFGAFVGDQVLRSIGFLLNAHMRPIDLAARFDGDELAAIVPHLRATDAVAQADRFREALMAHELVPHPNGAGRVTVSIGVADAIKGDTPEFLLRRAQNGLKVAKREGRNRVVEMSPDGPIWEAERRAR
jgi:diguanylate cyclase